MMNTAHCRQWPLLRCGTRHAAATAPAAAAAAAAARKRQHRQRRGPAPAAAAPEDAAGRRLVFALSAAAGHKKPHHPESPARIAAIQRALAASGLDVHPAVQQLRALPDSDSVLASLALVHPRGYLDRLQRLCAGLQGPEMVDDSTYIAPGSFDACCQSAAAVLGVLDAVLAARRTTGFALVRPPGHHVLPSRPMGFGLLNFVAAAARHAQQQRQLAHPVSKVMIVDLDVHHGNGSEEVFYGDAGVLYLSSHQQGLWPYTGKLRQLGVAEGVGATINLPLPGDAGHMAAAALLQQLVVPAARRFRPDLLLVSAGYDAHWRDPLAGLQFEGRTYHMLCAALCDLADELCGGRILFVLEGGYAVESLADSVNDSFAGVLGMPPLSAAGGSKAAVLREEPLGKVDALLAEARRLHGLD